MRHFLIFGLIVLPVITEKIVLLLEKSIDNEEYLLIKNFAELITPSNTVLTTSKYDVLDVRQLMNILHPQLIITFNPSRVLLTTISTIIKKTDFIHITYSPLSTSKLNNCVNLFPQNYVLPILDIIRLNDWKNIIILYEHIDETSLMAIESLAKQTGTYFNILKIKPGSIEKVKRSFNLQEFQGIICLNINTKFIKFLVDKISDDRMYKYLMALPYFPLKSFSYLLDTRNFTGKKNFYI